MADLIINRARLQLLDRMAHTGGSLINQNGQGHIFNRSSFTGQGVQGRCDADVKKLAAAGLCQLDRATMTYVLTKDGEDARVAARASYDAQRVQPTP